MWYISCHMRDFLKWLVYGSVFAVPFVLLIVHSSLFFPYITGKNLAFRALVEIGFAAWLLLSFYDKTYRLRYSPVTIAIGAFVLVMAIANLFGEYAPKSFWSNFERMEGWVTLVHFFLYFLVLESTLHTEKLWNRFLKTALVAGTLIALAGFGQFLGIFDVSQGTAWRIDGTLGNSSYLGVYMLFQMFIAAWLFLRERSRNMRYFYGALFFFFAFILFNTGTRGSILGLLGGGVLGFAYLALMAERGALIKKIALGGIVAFLLAASGLYALRDSAFVKNVPALDRVASISLSEGGTRFLVWQVAVEGVKERPLLGWGQENFNYVFNKYYVPALFAAESWYDRTHNIFLDWLIAGGVLGLLAYLAILGAALYHSVFVSLRQRFFRGAESSFSVEEQALILGLLAAYMFHNLFVFDNLASWISYAILLALISGRVSKSASWWPSEEWRRDTLDMMIVPLVGVVTVALVYMVNVPPLRSAADIIKAYQAKSVDEGLSLFTGALERGTLGHQEVAEQFVQVMGAVLMKSELSEAKRTEIKTAVNDAFLALEKDKPNDARVHSIHAYFYRMSGDYDRAIAEFKQAESLSPRKPDLIEEQGIIHLIAGRPLSAVAEFERAYALDENNYQVLVRQAAAFLSAGNRQKAEAILNQEELDKKGAFWYAFAMDNVLMEVAHNAKEYPLLLRIAQDRVSIDPQNIEFRTNLAAVYFEMGDKNRAVESLKTAAEDIPAFRADAERMINDLKGG